MPESCTAHAQSEAARTPETLALAISTAPLLIPLGTFGWINVGERFPLLLVVPVVIAVHAVLMVADRRRLAATRHGSRMGALLEAWSWLPGIYLWRRGRALGIPDAGRLARNWVLALAMSSATFTLAWSPHTTDQERLPGCSNDLATAGLARIYEETVAHGSSVRRACAGVIGGRNSNSDPLRYLIDQRGDEVVITIAPLAMRSTPP